MFQEPIYLIFLIVALAVSLSVHEAAHAWAATYFGDPTPKYAGRLTLNPLAHLDPLGTLMIFVAHFGWGKPVPVNASNFRNPRWGMLGVAVAGPLSNFVLALVGGLVLRMTGGVAVMWALFLSILIQLNLILMVFNLVPIPPLDGSKVVLALFPPRNPEDLRNYLHYGPWILLGIFGFAAVSGQPIISNILSPVVDVLWAFVMFQS